MDYKDDWPQAKQRLEAFWRKETIDRCCIGVVAPRKGYSCDPEPIPEEHNALVKWWIDPEVTLTRMLRTFERTYYGGEAFPVTEINLGASVMAAFFGSEPVFRPETVWYPQIIEDWDRDRLVFDPATNPHYRMVIENTRYYVEQSRGRYFVGFAELGSSMDILSLLRGMQILCYDMLDRGDVVKVAINRLVDAWLTVHEELYQIGRECNEGGSILAWMKTWAPGRHDQMACDFSAILSPRMFIEFAVPEIKRYLEWNEFATYHWDGPDAVKHLGTILALEDIDVIQWTPGAGQARTSSPRWMPLYKRIQAAGKGLYLLADIDEVETLLTELSSRGLYIKTSADSEEEAKDLLRKAERWSHA